jgi:hypothetical protein
MKFESISKDFIVGRPKTQTDLDSGRWSDMDTPSQNSVIFEKYFFGQKKILKNYKNWMVL